jgi:AbrB family looped-hinge helix DNA binding protein
MYDDHVDVQDDNASRIIGSVKVSARGQLSLPAEVRRRWGMEKGGTVEVVDFGESVMLVPGGDGATWRLICEAIPPEEYKKIVDEIGREDPDLAS